MLFIAVFAIGSTLLCRFWCDAPFGVLVPFAIESVWVGAELYTVYKRTLGRNVIRRYHGNWFVRLCKGLYAALFNLAVTVGTLAFIRDPYSLAGDIGLFFFCTVLVFRLICLWVYQPDEDIQTEFDRQRWNTVIHHDLSTADASDEDFRRDRSDEDWHGS